MSSHAIDLVAVDKHPFREILRLAVPLILSMTGLVFMQFIDGIFLAWYSPVSLAAMGFAGMSNYLIVSLFLGTAAYASTLGAQYIGAGRSLRAAASTWQAVYFSLGAGVVITVCGVYARPLMGLTHHAPDVLAEEIVYFRIMCMGGWAALLNNALSTFFSARGDTRTLMTVQLGGFAVNALLAYVLIFGKFGVPQMGIAGAALAAVIAQGLCAGALATLFLGRAQFRTEFGVWGMRPFDASLMARLVQFGLPSGFRQFVEMIGWSAFMFYLGRIDTVSLAATTVAFRINGLAFFPVIGLASAAAVLIGHAQGRHMPALSARITKRCMVLAEAWMLLWAVAFIALPHQLFAIFGATDAGNEAMTAQIAAAGVVMLRFVAIYCILDSCNIVYVFALQAAGDTRWTFVATIILYGGFVAALSIADALHATMAAEWTMVTIFAMTTAAVWVARFLQGKWRTIQVIESDIEVA